jgi:hypothetical protein
LTFVLCWQRVCCKLFSLDFMEILTLWKFPVRWFVFVFLKRKLYYKKNFAKKVICLIEIWISFFHWCKFKWIKNNKAKNTETCVLEFYLYPKWNKSTITRVFCWNVNICQKCLNYFDWILFLFDTYWNNYVESRNKPIWLSSIK